LVEAQIAKSKRDARQLVDAGAISVNGEKADLGYRLTTGTLLHNEIALIRKGKKSWHVARWRAGA
jgi:tyrosyl-tRNA synthetase